MTSISMPEDVWCPALLDYLHRCPTRECGRLVGAGSVYCCGKCQRADEFGYRPGHSEPYDGLHAERTAKLSGNGAR